GPTSAPCPTGSKPSHSVHGSTGSETPSSASSINSNTSEPWPHDTTSATTISSHPSNSRQSAYGSELMSRSPRAPCVLSDATQGRSNTLNEHRNDPKTAYTFRSDALD